MRSPPSPPSSSRLSRLSSTLSALLALLAVVVGSGCGSILGAEFDELRARGDGSNTSGNGGASGGASSGGDGTSGATGDASSSGGVAVGNCNSTTCFGCCAPGGICKPGNAVDACGANGAECTACDVTTTNGTGVCSAARACEATSCASGYVKCANGTKCCANAIKNGDFESEESNWTGWQKGDSAHAACAIVITNNTTPSEHAARLVSAYNTVGYQGCSLRQSSVTIPQAPRITLTFRFRDTDGYTDGKLTITLGTKQLFRESCPIGAGWVTKSIDLTSESGKALPLILENSELANGYSCEVDDLAIIAE